MTKKEMVKELVTNYVKQFEYGSQLWKNNYIHHDTYENKINNSCRKEWVERCYNAYKNGSVSINYVVYLLGIRN